MNSEEFDFEINALAIIERSLDLRLEFNEELIKIILMDG